MVQGSNFDKLTHFKLKLKKKKIFLRSLVSILNHGQKHQSFGFRTYVFRVERKLEYHLIHMVLRLVPISLRVLKIFMDHLIKGKGQVFSCLFAFCFVRGCVVRAFGNVLQPPTHAHAYALNFFNQDNLTFVVFIFGSLI